MSDDINMIHLFLLNNAAITADLRKVMQDEKLTFQKSQVEIATDKLVSDFVKQIDHKIQFDAERMTEFYKIFYMLENDIRVLVSETLIETYGDGWWSKSVPQIVAENVAKNQEREANEGLPPRSADLINYTTFGELGEIIKQNWDIFGGIFSNSTRNRVLRVINRLNIARGPIAHCGMLTEEDVVRLKLTVSDWYGLMV